LELHIPIDQTADRPLRDQVYDGLRRAILDRRLGPGARLPSTRTLAGHLAISRFTVEDAYARLLAEGYAEGRQGSGTYVVDLPAYGDGRGGEQLPTRLSPGGALPARRWSKMGQRLTHAGIRMPLSMASRFSLYAGTPALDAFPYPLWNRLRARIARTAAFAAHDYGSPAGEPTLRAAIAGYLARARGIQCSPERVVVTNGAQQALDLLARLLLDPGDAAIVEDPGYPSARQSFAATGARLVPIPVDVDGLCVERLTARMGNAKLIYITPSHQYPTGGVLPMSRRLALLEWARSLDVLVVEDDYDGEFRYGSRPVDALAGLDGGRGHGAQSVAYVGSFAKTLVPALRLGYVVLPADMVQPFVAAKSVTDRHQPTLEQLTLAAFITEGHFERHIARMRRLYAARRTALIEALDAELPSLARRDPATTDAGLHLLVGFDLPISEGELIARAARAGVTLEAASACYIASPPSLPSVLLGYSQIPDDQIREAIRTLARALQGDRSAP
jgi:GntR family transcriptional regulator/MocR family aminotransferase